MTVCPAANVPGDLVGRGPKRAVGSSRIRHADGPAVEDAQVRLRGSGEGDKYLWRVVIDHSE